MPESLRQGIPGRNPQKQWPSNDQDFPLWEGRIVRSVNMELGQKKESGNFTENVGFPFFSFDFSKMVKNKISHT